MRKILFFSALACMIVAMASCHKSQTIKLENYEDSLAYFTGYSGAGQMLQSIKHLPPEQLNNFNKADFLRGFKQMLMVDTVNESYFNGLYYGLQVAGQLNFFQKNDLDVDRKILYRAFEQVFNSDTINDKEIIYAAGVAEQLLQKSRQKMEENKMKKQKAVVEKNKKDGAAYAQKAMNADKSYKKTPSGLVYKVVSEGNGPQVTENDIVKINYVGRLIDGKVFDNSADHGGTTEMNVNEVIPGFTEGLMLMKKGGKYELIIPSNLAYGDYDNRVIPGGSTLIFEIELVDIMPKDAGSEQI